MIEKNYNGRYFTAGIVIGFVLFVMMLTVLISFDSKPIYSKNGYISCEWETVCNESPVTITLHNLNVSDQYYIPHVYNFTAVAAELKFTIFIHIDMSSNADGYSYGFMLYRLPGYQQLDYLRIEVLSAHDKN